jgi:hypothetical protein
MCATLSSLNSRGGCILPNVQSVAAIMFDDASSLRAINYPPWEPAVAFIAETKLLASSRLKEFTSHPTVETHRKALCKNCVKRTQR